MENIYDLLEMINMLNVILDNDQDIVEIDHHKLAKIRLKDLIHQMHNFRPGGGSEFYGVSFGLRSWEGLMGAKVIFLWSKKNE